MDEKSKKRFIEWLKEHPEVDGMTVDEIAKLFLMDVINRTKFADDATKNDLLEVVKNFN